MSTTTNESATPLRFLFVTGRLAEPSLRAVLADLNKSAAFEYDVAVLPISVAALMNPKWVERHLHVPEGIGRVILPGHCQGDWRAISEKFQVEVELGPKDLRDLPRYFGRRSESIKDYGKHDIEILAEINHAPRLPLAELLRIAEGYREAGADMIDVGCDPGGRWEKVGESVRALKSLGLRVSIDSFDPAEVADAVEAGAELVLSVNATNREHALNWGVEVVAIPDTPHSLEGLEETSRYLSNHGVPHRLDPVLDPIGFGFAQSLGRYLEIKRRLPGAAIMMGIGNLTELTDADSAGINTLLIGFCQETGIKSVLTTEVINWARTSVREIDIARRLMYQAVTHQTLPKHIDPRLVMLRDPSVPRFGPEALAEIARRIKDRNWRIFAEDGQLIAINGSKYLVDNDPFLLFDRMEVEDPSHAFYLGYELMKAHTALTLNKSYRQDEALDWGFLTRPEVSHRSRPSQAKSETTK